MGLFSIIRGKKQHSGTQADTSYELSEETTMRDCEHPWRDVHSHFEYGERYDRCNLCGHIMTSRIIEAEVEKRLSQQDTRSTKTPPRGKQKNAKGKQKELI